MEQHDKHFYGYAIIAVSFCIQVVNWGICNSFGIFYDPLLDEFNWLRGTLSGAASLCFLVHGITSILVGNLNDRFGPRRIMTVCALFLGLGFFLMSRVHAVWQLYLFYGIVVGIGLSGTDVVLLSTLARWFERKRGMMSGIIKIGTGVGMLVMPLFITRLLNGLGWRNTFLILGLIITTAVMVLAQFLVRDPAEKAQWIDNRKRIGQCPGKTEEEGLSFQAAIRTRQFKTICAVYFIVLVCVFTILMHIVQHAIDMGIAAGPAAGILSTVGGVSIAGRFVMGSAGDRIGDKAALAICFVILLMSLCCLQLADRLGMLYAFAIPYGFAHGGFFALNSPITARLFGTRSHGMLLGIIIFCSTVGGAIGPLAAGYLFDVFRNYKLIFLIMTALSAIGLALTLSLRPLPFEQRAENRKQKT